MFDAKTISWDAFEQQVQGGLQHLYDYSFLHAHPLVHWLVPNESGPERVEIFRDLMLETIERLRPGANVSFHAKASRNYNILMLRYVSQQSIQEVSQQLAISERQFYREHPKALRSVSSILWERLTGAPTPAAPAPEQAEISLEAEIQHVHAHAGPSGVELQALLATVVHDTRILAEQYHVDVALAPNGPAVLDVDGTVLRQVALALTSHLLTRSSPQTRLAVAHEIAGHQHRVVFRLTAFDGDRDALRAGLENQSMLASLVNALDATLTYSTPIPDGLDVVLQLKAWNQSILIVDDNPDAVDLFERYLAGHPYEIHVVRNGTAALQTARDLQPDIIILDLMMPGTDGLEIMQNLKNHAATGHIPVLVCSVLDMQALAMSLRADDYLKKPPGQAELLTALARWRA